MSDTNNDSYTVSQSNGESDNDQNLNGISLGQLGGVDIAVDHQDITSGGNTQTNTSDISDFGLPTSSDHSQNDDYTVGQSNNLFDNDHNTNVFDTTQYGGANVVFADQHITSGGDTQTNTSNLFDSGWTGSHSDHSSNDAYDVTQFNGLRDDDTNGNSLVLDQNTAGPWTADLAFVSQNTDSGGDTQTNNSGVIDSGFSEGSGGWGGGWGGFSSMSFGGGGGGGGGYGSSADHDNNDSYTVDQSNTGLDNDTNYNIADLGQTGTADLSFLTQDIHSGDNNQSNTSGLFDTGSAFYSGHDNNDMFNVGQNNQMADNDGNANKLTLDQMYAVNINGVTQTIDSGHNSQADNSSIFDYGSALGFGHHSGSDNNNDSYTVDQGNMMIDNDINLNIGIVAQVGYGNAATIDQSVDAGDNTQVNNSGILDLGSAFGSGSHGNNDTYGVQESNLLSDSDANENMASVTQLVGASNLADFEQAVDSGHNDSGNHSNLFDIGS